VNQALSPGLARGGRCRAATAPANASACLTIRDVFVLEPNESALRADRSNMSGKLIKCLTTSRRDARQGFGKPIC